MDYSCQCQCHISVGATMFSVYTLYCVLCIYNEDCGRSSVAMCSLMTNSAVACRWGIWPDIDFRCRLDISFQCRADIGNRCRPDVIFDVGLMSSRSVALRRLSVGNCSVFRLDALALSVIATATWLAGWLGVRHTPSGIVSKRLNLSENFFDHLKAPSL